MRPTNESIRKAVERIRPYLHSTPVYTSAALDQICGAKLFLKAENRSLQGSRSGEFSNVAD